MHLGIAKTPFLHFHLTTESSNGKRLQILDTHREFQSSASPTKYSGHFLFSTLTFGWTELEKWLISQWKVKQLP